MRFTLITAALCLAPLAATAAQDAPQKASLTTYVQPGPVTWPDPSAAKPAAPSATVLEDVPLPEPRPEQIAQPKLGPGAAPQYSHEEVCETLVAAARERGLPVAFFARLIWQESQFKPYAVSPVGAVGIAQFMPETARGMELANPFDALQALPASAELLDTLKRRFGNIGLAAAAYNSTPKRIANWLKNKATLPDETKRYVLTITGRPAESWKAARAHGPLPQLPRQVPCTKLEDFVEVEQAERREHERVQEQMIAERAEAERTRVASRTQRGPSSKQKAPIRLAQKATRQIAELTSQKKKGPARVAENKAKSARTGSKPDKPAKGGTKVKVAAK